jgi:type I restriction enzyme S subunit
MTEWRDCKFGEIATFSYGKMPNKKNIVDCGYPIFSGYKIVGYYNSYMYEDPQLIIVARGVGGTGDVKISPPKSYITNLSIIAELHPDKANKKFLYYYFKINNLRELDSGSAQSQITINDLNNYCITLPPLPEQKAIAEVLSSLDDKIDLLTRQNKTLEDLAQAYFRKWFIEDASDEWEVGKLGDFVEVIDNRGKTPPYQDIPTEYPIIEVKSISGDNRFIDYQKCEKFVLESTYKTWFRGYIKPLDVLVSTVGSVGEIAQVLLEHGVIAQNVIGLRSKGTSPYHLFEYMKYMKNEIKELDIGSVQPSIKVPHLLSLQYVKPDRDSLRKFDDFSKELVNKMISNFMQIQTLQKLRDTLLPKLISGEIRVKM